MGGMNVFLNRPRSSASMTLMMMLTWPALSAYGGAHVEWGCLIPVGVAVVVVPAKVTGG